MNKPDLPDAYQGRKAMIVHRMAASTLPWTKVSLAGVGLVQLPKNCLTREFCWVLLAPAGHDLFAPALLLSWELLHFAPQFGKARGIFTKLGDESVSANLCLVPMSVGRMGEVCLM